MNAIRWTVGNLVVPQPTTDREQGQAINLLRKTSKGFDAIFRNKGL